MRSALAGSCLLAVATLVGDAHVVRAATQPDVRAVAGRAVAYLAVEVPRWRREHSCYSCHNNGDAARALIAASARGYPIGDALDETLGWLTTPERWDANESRGGSEDLPLARIQFSSALAAVVAAGRAPALRLDQTAKPLVAHQRDDGSWKLSETQLLGGATFYGTSLATAMARRSLAGMTSAALNASSARAGSWLRTTAPQIVLDASAILYGLMRDTDPAAVMARQRALAVLKRGQGPDGGWGPYVTSQSEPFDTALAVLALVEARRAGLPEGAAYTAGELDSAAARALEYLADTQAPGGHWQETTRPPNGESYAQRISTTAWALLALLESD